MARKIRRSAPPTPNNGGAGRRWGGYIAVGLACAALGSGGTYLALRPALALASSSRSQSAQASREMGNGYEDHGQWPQAAAAYTQAIAGGIDNPDIRTDLGVAYFKSSQPQKALEQYVIAQRQDPKHENSLFNEASAYAVLGDSKRAIAIWRLYLQRFPQGHHVADAKNFITTVQAHGLTPARPTGP